MVQFLFKWYSFVQSAAQKPKIMGLGLGFVLSEMIHTVHINISQPIKYIDLVFRYCILKV